MRKFLAIFFSLAITFLAVSMAIVSAGQRATDPLDRWLLSCISVIIVVAVHLLPALLRQRSGWVVWPVWSLCLIMALVGHAGFFTNASQAAAEARSAQSASARAIAAQRQEIEQTLATIRARPVSVVASLYARTTDDARRSALAVELAESKRAAALRDRLVTLTESEANTPITDLVTARVTAVTGVSAEVVALSFSLLGSLLVELLGMLLWREALTGQEPTPRAASLLVKEDRQCVASGAQRVELIEARNEPSQLDRLRLAVERGECSTRVQDIRSYLSCGQAKAAELRRALITT
jgi:hypothetical protein